MIERLKRVWFLLLAAAVVSAVGLPRLIDRAAAPPREDAAPAPTVATAPRLVVRDPDGQAIGWLRIRYPQTIRENQEGILEAEYTTGDTQWEAGDTQWKAGDGPDGGAGYRSVRPPTGMKVELSGADLALAPSPIHDFDVARIAATGSERVKWIVSPKKEGDHMLLVRFAVSPATFKAVPISANGEALGDDPQLLLPVKVVTIYGVPKAAVLIAKSGVGLLSFLLTLPAALLLFDKLFRQKRKVARRRRDRGDPAPPA
jgi:hypothetical protein